MGRGGAKWNPGVFDPKSAIYLRRAGNAQQGNKWDGYDSDKLKQTNQNTVHNAGDRGRTEGHSPGLLPVQAVRYNDTQWMLI